jgi:hypothetical protein
MRVGIVYGDDLPLKTSRVWQTWGVNVVLTYGSLETGGVVAFSGYGASGSIRHFDGVGDIVLEDSSSGSVQIKSANVTGGLISSSPGDRLLGDQGSPIGIRRSSSDIVEPNGRRISMVEIEAVLLQSEFINQAVAWLATDNSVDALCELNLEVAEAWARRHSISFTTRADLVSHPALLDLMEVQVSGSNNELASRGLPVIARFVVTTDLKSHGVLSRNDSPIRGQARKLADKLFEEKVARAEEQIRELQPSGTETEI